ncbi:MAG TPA: cobalamin-binding protein [Rectinemataceae bacterium]|nr:cobalamin-binding protein [Rectinemataceae bacterium]
MRTSTARFRLLSIVAASFVFGGVFGGARLWAQAKGVSAVDSLGRRVSLSAPARRIVSLSPEATETLYAVGAGPAMVADTTYCDYPDAARALPKVGGFSPQTVSIEKILTLKPDLVVTAGRLHAQLEAALVKLGIRVFAYEPENFVAIADCMMSLGELAGQKNQGIRAAATFTAAIEKVKYLTSSLPTVRRPKVFWEVSGEPLMTCGRKSFAHQLVDAAGGRDIFADLPGPWPVVSAEEVLTRSPQVIIGPDDLGESLSEARLAVKPGWKEIPAVREGRIFLVPADLVSRAGPRLATGLLAVLKVIHPELVP